MYQKKKDLIYSSNVLDLEYHWNQVKLILILVEETSFEWNFFFSKDTKYADDDAILLLENIKLSNYDNEDKYIGFNTETTFSILKVRTCQNHI